jgi:hypothetical protein
MVTIFLPIRRKRNRGSWEYKPAEGAERLLRYEERKKRRGGEEKKKRWSDGRWREREEEEESRWPLFASR